jgi:hypothetical protein
MTCVEASERMLEKEYEEMHDRAEEMIRTCMQKLWRVLCTSIPERRVLGRPRVGGMPASEDLCWGGVSGSMADQCVQGDASTAGGIILQHMDMTKLMME